MKLSRTQLRHIIQETVNEALIDDPTDHEDPFNDVADFLSQSLSDEVNFDSDLIGSNAFEAMLGTLGEEGVPTLARKEDLEATAEFVVERVLESEIMRESVKKIALNFLENLMNEQGSPFR